MKTELKIFSHRRRI